MLKLFGPDTRNETIAYARLKLRNRNSQEVFTILRYESCVTKLMIDRMRDPKAASRALGMSALLLGFMGVAGKNNWRAKSVIHFEGAAKVFRSYHDSICDCDNHRTCSLWSPYAPQSPEVRILDRVLRDIGVEHRLLEAYTPEDETALARQRYGTPKTTVKGM